MQLAITNLLVYITSGTPQAKWFPELLFLITVVNIWKNDLLTQKACKLL